ncbi:glycosyltransferase family 2 protein [Acidobacteriota bacterium]
MKTSFDVSVIIPTKNRSESLERAIKSVLDQSYEKFEIIIVDDGSDDNTSEIARRFEVNHSNIHYIRNSHSVGAAEARNIGMRQAKGEIIAFLDDDDEWLPKKLEKQIEIFLKNPDVGIIGTNSFWIDVDNNNTIKKKFLKKQSFKMLLVKNSLGSFSFVSIKKELFDKWGGIRPDMKSFQDWIFWLKLAPHTKIRMADDYLVKYYDYSGDPNRITGSTDRDIESLKKIIQDFQKNMVFLVRLNHKLWIWQRENFIYNQVKSKFIILIIRRILAHSHNFLNKKLIQYYCK